VTRSISGNGSNQTQKTSGKDRGVQPGSSVLPTGSPTLITALFYRFYCTIGLTYHLTIVSTRTRKNPLHILYGIEDLSSPLLSYQSSTLLSPSYWRIVNSSFGPPTLPSPPPLMSTKSTAVGIDAGNATSVIAAARGRGVDVILNEESSRETPSCLSFPPSSNHRLFGSAAVASHTLSPSSFFTYLKQHIYTRSSHDNTRFSSPVQLFAMLLAHLKSIAEKNLQTSVNACVIGIPSYFTNLERRAYLDAAEIAGLKPLRLMHDLTATGLGYGLYKSDKGLVNYVAVVDVGECDTQVSVLAFESGGMRVLSHASDPSLGGRDFDQVLYDHFVEKFKAEYKIDVRGNRKASVRLQMACEKVKKILSANAEAPLSIECLMEEKDVKGLIKREEFEKMCAGLIDRVLEPCKKAIGWSGLPGVDRLSAVELVGSGSRVPAISRVLAGYFGRESGRTINASECVARGCALHCAMLSPVFKVKDYEVGFSLFEPFFTHRYVLFIILICRTGD
jgi:heat shock 70kDa protein 4